MRKLSADPLYRPYSNMLEADIKPLGGGPSTGPVTIPRSQTAVDARTLGYACPTVTMDMHVARREGDENGRKPPAEQPHKENA